MKTMLRNLLIVLAILGWASAAPAAVLFSETFSYPNGRLTSVSGGLWTPNSGGFPMNVSNGKVTLFHTPANCCGVTIQGEDVSRGYSALTAGQTLYAGLDVSASGNTTTSGFPGSGLTFATTGARTLFVKAFTGSDFTFGIGGSTTAASWPNGLAFGATYRVVTSYEFDTGISKLWVNPADESSTYVSVTAAAFGPLSAFTLWQMITPVGTPSAAQVLDNLVLGTSFNDVLTVPPPTLPGDYNNDDTVDAADYVVWRKTEVPPDGYATWSANYGESLGSGAGASINASVPEPATLVMLIVAAVGISLRRPRIA